MHPHHADEHDSPVYGRIMLSIEGFLCPCFPLKRAKTRQNALKVDKIPNLCQNNAKFHNKENLMFKLLPFLLCCCCLLGCWDTVTTMSPGDSVDIDTIAIGEDYTIDGCVLSRASEVDTAPAPFVITSTSFIWGEAKTDATAAKQKYLNMPTRVTGIISEITDWHPDIVRITFSGAGTVRCELRTEMSELALQKLIGERRTLAGQIHNVVWGSIWLYDCIFVEE